jgi:general stress protein YciG
MDKPKLRRGMALVDDPEVRQRIASMGGIAAHKKGTAHEFNTQEAQAAGRKGGRARAEKLRAAKAALATA